MSLLMFWLVLLEMQKKLEEPKITPEERARLQEEWRAKKEAEKEARREELKKQWEEEKLRRKEEREKVKYTIAIKVY